MATRKTNGGSTRSAAEREVTPQKIKRELEKPELPAKARATKEKTATVTFNVTVPDSTAGLRRSVFLAGTLHQVNDKIYDWDTRAQPMKKVDKNHWTISVSGPVNAVIEYKYTLGDWDTVERDQHCHDIANRRVTLPGKTGDIVTINDTVHSWRNIDPCGK